MKIFLEALLVEEQPKIEPVELQILHSEEKNFPEYFINQILKYPINFCLFAKQEIDIFLDDQSICLEEKIYTIRQIYAYLPRLHDFINNSDSSNLTASRSVFLKKKLDSIESPIKNIIQIVDRIEEIQQTDLSNRYNFLEMMILLEDIKGKSKTFIEYQVEDMAKSLAFTTILDNYEDTWFISMSKLIEIR